MQTESVDLYGWVEFDEYATTIRAKLFEQMLIRALPIVKHYQGDLFHDALWVNENVNGPMSFDWCVRTWGTHISTEPAETNSAIIGAEISRGDKNLVLYKVTLRCDERNRWFSDFERIDK